MSDRSFVETLELATVNRPTNLRAEREFVSNPQIRRGEARGAAPVIGDRLRAAVNAGALVSFVAGLSAWGAEEIGFWVGAQKMTLNSALYAKHRDAVAARLAAEASDYIAELEIV